MCRGTPTRERCTTTYIADVHDLPGGNTADVDLSKLEFFEDFTPDELKKVRALVEDVTADAGAVRLVEGSWFEPLPDELRGEVGVIASNPPYVPEAEPLPALVDEWEPSEALRSGADGLDDIRTIVAQALDWLAPGGALVVEHGDAQGEATRSLAVDAGFGAVQTGQDLAGRDRFLVARR